MIRLQDISKSFGHIRALDHVSLAIPAKEITILAGADGAGKSTLLKMILGIVRQDSGQIFLKNREIERDYRPLTAITGYMPERFSLYPDLTVEENMNFFADIHEVSRPLREERKQRLLEKTGMIRFRNRRAGALSGGMKQKLALSTILLAAPEIIILDEPTTGVDPMSRVEFFTIIRELKAEGKTIIMSTPYLDEAEQGDYIVFIKNGRLIKADRIADLRSGFPARLYRILPKGPVFDTLIRLNQKPEWKESLYIRGRYIKYLQTGPENLGRLIPAQSIEEETPSLEDIYLYYERSSH